MPKRRYKQYLKKEAIEGSIPVRTKYRTNRMKKLNLDHAVVQADDEFDFATFVTPGNNCTSHMNAETNDESMSDFTTEEHSLNTLDLTFTNVEEQLPPISEYIYEGSKITAEESSLLLLAFISRHKLTKVAADELIQLIDLHLPLESFFPKSFHRLKKKMEYDYSLASFHFYCPNCKNYLGADLENNCGGCKIETERESLVKEGSFFLSFDFKRLLENLLSDTRISNQLRECLHKRNINNSDKITDITDGFYYKKLELSNNDISCTFNTDGVPVFKSSKFSVWPILFSVNELPYSMRSANTMLAGLWFGNSKPEFNSFFSPFVQSCNMLSEFGILWQANGSEICSKVYFPLLVTDSVARCLCQGLTQFNGAYGCTWCHAKGETLKLDESSHKWIYPSNTVNSEQRTGENFLANLKTYNQMLAMQTCSDTSGYFGIKSASQLLLLRNFNIVSGFSFDYMHTAFLGISRAFTNHWLDSKNCKELFYCGTSTALIDKKLLCCLVPFEYDRATRSIQNIKFWKASEWRTWTYLSIFVMKNILSECYLAHFSKYVQSIMLLSGESITQSDISLARNLLNEFIFGVETLYGMRYCSYNVHILSHAADCVAKWGPLWSYSAFQFENYNGILLNLFNGTRYVELQIANNIIESMSLVSRGRDIRTAMASNLFNQLMKHKKLYKNIIKVGEIIFVGKGTLYNFSRDEKSKLESDNISFTSAKCYKRCILRSIMYNNFDATTSKRCNCVVEAYGNIYIIQKLICLSTDDDCKEGICLGFKLRVKENCLLKFYLDVVDVAKTLSILRIRDMTSKFICYLNKEKNIRAIIRIPNCSESE